VDKELENDHLVHRPYPITGSCIHHPSPEDFSLFQEHTNTTVADTYKYPTYVLHVKFLLHTAESTLQPVNYCSSATNIQESCHIVTIKKLIQV